jgi:hypothetical protein
MEPRGREINEGADLWGERPRKRIDDMDRLRRWLEVLEHGRQAPIGEHLLDHVRQRDGQPLAARAAASAAEASFTVSLALCATPVACPSRDVCRQSRPGISPVKAITSCPFRLPGRSGLPCRWNRREMPRGAA